MGKPAETLEEVDKTTAVAQKWADANPTNRNYRFMGLRGVSLGFWFV